jgi:hypothetical protein
LYGAALAPANFVESLNDLQPEKARCGTYLMFWIDALIPLK